MPSAQRLSLGANVLYWIDDDAAWTQGGLLEVLRRAQITTLRFPGGEVADNFDWERNALERPDDYPGEAPTDALKAQRLDHEAFLRYARQLGAGDVFLVVNLESAYLAPGNTEDNILRYAKKAAAWVKEVKRLGYRVRHWEVGNESYLKETSYPLTASEYAHAVSIYSREMKKADPDILIGVHGPASLDESGFADSLTDEQLEYVRGNGKAVCAGRLGKDCVDEIRKRVPGRAEDSPWWDVVLREAQHSIDFAVVHRYSRAEAYGFRETDRLIKLRTRMEKAVGRCVGLAVTEWNVPYKGLPTSDQTQAALDNLVALGAYMAAGASHAHFWPVRFQHNDGRALLTFEQGAPTASYRALQLFAPMLLGSPVRQAMLGDDVYMLHTRTEADERVMLINRGRTPVSVSIPGATAQVHQLAGPSMTEGRFCRISHDRRVEVELPPASISVAIVVATTGTEF